jgi:transcriptional regulator with PAS, ATPase and Fis domain
MGAKQRQLPVVAIVAADPQKGDRIAEALARVARPQLLTAAQLRDPGRCVDATAAVAVLEPEFLEGEVEALLQARSSALGERLIVVSRDVADDALGVALERLRPAAWLPDPAPRPALELALQQLGVSAASGLGARADHRPTRVIVGVSSAIRDILREVARIAPTRLAVLILGETGTGKELIARAIHQQSERAARPFVAVNCGALAETLLEAELFGAKKGAYTGSASDRPGLFEQAHGGTLFLDEIGETTAALQVKLLRALEEGEVRPVGSDRTIRVDVRVVCATHRELRDLIASGAFRQDLFYRINAATLYVPPLRRRRVDIPFLAQHFAEEFGEAQARRVVLGEEFLRALEQQDLPGNVRELRNLIERAIALTRPGDSVTIGSLAAPTPAETAAPGRPETLQVQVEGLEQRLIRDALRRFAGNRSRVAEALGLSRQGLRNRMARYGVE